MVKVPGYDKPVEFGVIHSFAYKLADGSGELVVATTRIETMLGDTAVAVHPDDERYKAHIGKSLVHPFIKGREIKVIGDSELVDMAFGTGCVKVTPAHDPNDYSQSKQRCSAFVQLAAACRTMTHSVPRCLCCSECGQKHKLQFINLFTNEGLINANGGDLFAGKKRFDVRELIIVELEKLGLYRGKAANKMALGLCSRSKDVIEPVLRPQWYVQCASLVCSSCFA